MLIGMMSVTYQDAFPHGLRELFQVLGLVEAPGEEDDGGLVAGALLLPAAEHLPEEAERLVVVEVAVRVEVPHLGAHLNRFEVHSVMVCMGLGLTYRAG